MHNKYIKKADQNKVVYDFFVPVYLANNLSDIEPAFRKYLNR